MSKYNGWTNKQTWQVALWLGNNEYVYKLVNRFKGDYNDLVTQFQSMGITKSPDGVNLKDETLNTQELSDYLKDIRST